MDLADFSKPHPSQAETDNLSCMNNSFAYSIGNVVKVQLCALCIREDFPLIKISSCKHFLASKIFELQVSSCYENKLICYECHNVLKKVCTLKEIALENYNLLESQSYENFSARKNNLQFSKIELIYTIECQPLEFVTLEPSFKIKTELNLSELIHYNTIDSDEQRCFYNEDTIVKNEDLKDCELKIINEDEVASDNSGVDEMPRGKIKSKRSKVTKKLLHKRGRATNNKYDGKIKLLSLSYQEMMKERRNEAKKESYLKKKLKCESCITTFDYEETYKEHIVKRHEAEGYTCQVCKSVQSTEASNKEHYQRHFRRYKCEACDMCCSNLYSAIKHYSEKHEFLDTEYRCSECEFTAQSKRQYRYHKEKHKGKMTCPECGNHFANKSSLRTHIFGVHKHPNQIWSCKLCDKVYQGKPGLLTHMQSVHEKQSSADTYCVQCDVKFKHMRALEHHLKTNAKHITDQDKRFVCSECGARYITRALLRDHIDWEHKKITKHVCSKCSKKFRNRQQLKKHVDYVHEKKRAPRDKICDYCGKAFRTLQLLRPHIRTHTGERPLRCPHCVATFAHPAARYNHCKLVHAENKVI